MPPGSRARAGSIVEAVAQLAVTVRIATRSSPLALWQARWVAQLIEEELVEGGSDAAGDRPLAQAAGQLCRLVRVETEGDRDQQIPIDQMAGRGVFVAEVRLALLDGRADIAVHSAKDLPSAPELAVEGLVIAAVPERGDPRDALVGCSLEQLPPGATVATGAVRRRAQLAWLRPDLGFVGLRGNIGTRLDRVPPGGAVLMAAVALERLGMAARIAEILPRSVMMPQVGQGAMAVECRAGDSATRALLSRIDHRPSSLALAAERAFLGRLGGGCDLPIGAHATVVEGVGEPEIELEALVASPDGHVVVTGRLSGQDPQMLGEELAIEVIERRGGRVLLGYDYTPRGG